MLNKLLGICVVFLVAMPCCAATNSITITERSGSTQTNYPVQFGRPFVQGEIAGYPQAKVNGEAVTTQADVKTRWGDGSVKHAVISFVITSLTGSSTNTITFQNQETGNNTGYLDKSGMMGAEYDFGATINLNSGASISSAVTMLNADKFEYWLRGSVCTSIIIADHTGGYDYGVFRPIFHATFWPTINKVRVRFIGEVANTENFSDINYDITSLTIGRATPFTWYSKSSVTHYAGSRWTKDTWFNTQNTISNAVYTKPAARSINHNINYMVTTKLIPNYDITKSPSESIVSSEYSAWSSASKDIYDSGLWTKNQSTGGGRREIGPIPCWSVRWLYTGDYRMEEMSIGQANLSGAWNWHFREADASKAAYGRALTITDRPTIWLSDYNIRIDDTSDGANSTSDRINHGTLTNGGWLTSSEHTPEAQFIPYLLTGDFWHLEELYFQASWGATSFSGGANTASWSRGTSGAYGGLSNNDWRAQAWLFRDRIHAATVSPDGSYEKTYFTALVGHAIAQWEGSYNIVNGYYAVGRPNEDISNWDFGYNVLNGQDAATQDSSLRYLGPGLDSMAIQDPNDPAKVLKGQSMWEMNYLLWSLGRGYELGYPTKYVLDTLATIYISILNSSQPKYIGMYRLAVKDKSTNTWYKNIEDIYPDLLSSWGAYTGIDDYWSQISKGSGAEHGYAYIALSAGAMLYDTIGASVPWGWMIDNVSGDSVLNDNPKWAITQRGASVSRRATGGGTIAGPLP